MKRLNYLIFMFMMVSPAFLSAQTATVGSKVGPVKICDPSNEPVELPYLGKKNLLIFYVDPDKANQNKEFRENLERTRSRATIYTVSAWSISRMLRCCRMRSCGL